MEKLIVGSRGNRLAIMQAEIVINQLLVRQPDLLIERRTFQTLENPIQAQCMQSAAEKEGNRKDLDEALLDGEIDIAVHSLKDLPREVPEELPIVAFTEREDARDVLLVRRGVEISEGLDGLQVGTSSLRRKVQLESLYKGAKIKELHGSIITRIKRMDDGEYDAIILAAAGVKRAGLTSRISRYFTVDEMVPAAGQGILAVQARKECNDPLFAGITDENATIEAMAERAYIREMGDYCNHPVGAHACIKNNKLYLTGMYYVEKREKCFKESVIGYKSEAEKLGIFFANYMKRRYRL